EMVDAAQIAELKSAPSYIPGSEPVRRGGGPIEALPIPFNTSGFHRREVVERGDGALTFIEAPPYSAGQTAVAPGSVDVAETDDSVVMENSQLRAEFSREGLLISLIHKITGRETMAEPGNRMEIYDDHPTAWDAWDVDPFHLETRQDCPPAESCEVTLQSPLRVEVTFERSIGRESRMRQTARLDAGSPRLEFHTTVEWHESHKMLKVAFPVNVRALNATYEMQFGCVERPTHYNTMYDLARFEVPGHKWADLSEHGFGVSLLSESKYGFSTFGSAMRISLLRSPKEPDPEADMGDHQFSYAILPHADGWREAGIVAEGYRFNQPFLWTEGRVLPQSFAAVDSPNLVLDTIKKAEDDDALVLRLYECHGARGTAQVKCSFPVQSATFCNLLEEEGEAAEVQEASITIPYGPYQIVSVKVR
nr:glycosyl hydrolase-related protein [Armatimonadota bacterium]